MTAIVLATALGVLHVHPAPIEIRFEKGVKSDVARLTWRAARYWNCALGKEVFQSRGRSQVKILKAKPLSKRSKRSADEVVALAGTYTWESSKRAYIRLDTSTVYQEDGYIEGVLRHELGHVLGLDDVLNLSYSGVMRVRMSEYWEPPRDATPIALARVRARYKLARPSWDSVLCWGAVLDQEHLHDPRVVEQHGVER